MSRYFTLLILSFYSLSAYAQQEIDSINVDSTQYDEVRGLVNIYEYMLNTIGSSKSTTRDKEVIITESYKKIFINQDVQIEDDLIHDRSVITNKDISSYLRDVDFFFKEVQFDFENIEVQKIERDEGSFYYLVSFESWVNGTTIEDDIYAITKKRFIEVNINEDKEDLKIASVYSTKVSREMELQSWWTSLSFGWINIFKDYVQFDSITNPVLLRIAAIDSLNLSGYPHILNIEPLAALKNLKVLDISHSKITDLSPLRYARSLRKLSAANTPIEDITSIQYFEKLTYLDLSRTDVVDIYTIGRLKKLTYLDLSNTEIISFEPLNYLNSLENINLSSTSFSDPILLLTNTSLLEANLSRTGITQLSVFHDLQRLVQLNVSETNINDINGMEGHPKLEILSINQTLVNQLDPSMRIPNLKKVYADFTGITEKMASVFMSKNPNTIVITNSVQVMEWWNALPYNWKTIFTALINESNPGKEDLVKLINLDSIDLSNRNLYEIAPLTKFKHMRYLDVSGNQFTSFEFTEEMTDLAVLKGVGLPVKSTFGLEKNPQLRFLNLSESLLEDIQYLSYLNKLEHFDADNTYVDEVQVVKLLGSNPNLIIIYQTEPLLNWWSDLSPEWKSALNIVKPDSYNLHKLIEQKEVSISNSSITSLSPLNIFINLEKLNLDRVGVASLDEIFEHQNLRQLSCTNSPLQTLKGISQLNQLELLNISNTAIEDLKKLEGLSTLKHLNCSGTGIKNLKGISELYDLESLNVSNTRIWKLDRLMGMQNLKSLICYNTRIRARTIDEFEVAFPDCEITFY